MSSSVPGREHALRITGGAQLSGSICVSGSKNAALPEMAAALLTREAITLSNVPRVTDTSLMAQILAGLGGSAEGDGTVVALIDTGVDFTHPALAGSLVPGGGYTRGQPSGSVYQSRYTSPILDQSTSPILDAPADDSGHGTMVAGLIHLVAPAASRMSSRSPGVMSNMPRLKWRTAFCAPIAPTTTSSTRVSHHRRTAPPGVPASGERCCSWPT